MAYIIEAQKLEKSRRWTKKLVCLKNDYIPSTFKGISPKSVKINWSNYNEKKIFLWNNLYKRSKNVGK